MISRNLVVLKSLINKPTFVQSINPTCIDLFKSKTTQSVLEVGISRHHSFITVALRSQLVTGNNIKKICQDYKTLNIKSLVKTWKNAWKPYHLWLFIFSNVFLKPLNKHAPTKKKMRSFNSNPFCVRSFDKCMQKSKLKNMQQM